LVDIEAEEDGDFVGFVDPVFPLAFGDAAGLRLPLADREAAEDALVDDEPLAEAPPAEEREVDFFLVVGMSVSVAESVEERWGWNKWCFSALR
jgi:hypothetical protein